MFWVFFVGKCYFGFKMFLCVIYVLICLYDKEKGDYVNIKLCKLFCESVRKSCEFVMSSNNYIWLSYDVFNCMGYMDNFMCV